MDQDRWHFFKLCPEFPADGQYYMTTKPEEHEVCDECRLGATPNTGNPAV